MKRTLTNEETKEILSLTEDDITLDLLRNYFAIRKGQNNPRFNTFDTFILPRNKLYNKEEITTTIGRYLINFFVLPYQFLEKFGYQNIVLDADSISSLEGKMATLLLDDIVTTKEYATYLDRGEWITLGTVYFLAPSIDLDMNTPIPEVIKRRDELFKEFEKEIKEGNPNVVSNIEKELLDLSRKLIKEKGNEGYDFYESKEFKFENNYKKTSIMGGVMESPYTKKLDILKSNYSDGISREEFPLFANSTIIGGYSRGVETQKAGYETKKINNATQTISLDEAGSDCGTTQYLKITIPAGMKNMFYYRYILDGGKLLMLTEGNISNYLDKEVMMRSPLYCKTDKICNKCAGELYYKMGIKNAGLLSSTMSGSIMNLNLKKTHDQTVKFKKIDIRNFIVQH